jgi:subtilisin-like proprotein convertase family protein
MRKYFFALVVLFCNLYLFSQSPQAIPYQAVVRNADGSAMSSTAMTMTFKIHDVSATGTVVYQESHTTTSNAQGLVILQVGQGQAAVGTFDNINWGSGAKFLHVMMNAGAGEIDLGTQQMMSVPYALYAEKSGGSMPTGSAPGELMYWNGSGWSSIPPGGYGKPLCMCDGVPSWGGCIPKLGNFKNINSYYIQSSWLDLPDVFYFNFFMLDSIISFGTPDVITSVYNSYAYIPAGIEISTDSLFLEDVINMGGSVTTQDGISIYIITFGAHLQLGTTYYLRAYCQNSIGTGYSPIEPFTTPNQVIPGCTINNACNYNSLANFYDASCKYHGQTCDDNNASTFGDVVNENCVCAGVPVVLGCTNQAACNYNNLADMDDGNCLYAGLSCNDGNVSTTLDYVNANCQCEGLQLQPQLIPEDGVTCLMDTIVFSQFSSTSIIQSLNQIQDVMVNLEHSFMGDLSIKLICPNQASVFLHQQGGGGTWLGEPIDVDADISPGVGYNYFWSPSATNGTWIANGSPGTSLPSGTYSSVESFNNLIGCPMNGAWVIQICDLWQGDNGYLFDWNLHLLSN